MVGWHCGGYWDDLFWVVMGLRRKRGKVIPMCWSGCAELKSSAVPQDREVVLSRLSFSCQIPEKRRERFGRRREKKKGVRKGGVMATSTI